MTALIRELDFITAGVGELEPYLLSDELYWQITGMSGLQSLTIGNLLLSIKKTRSHLNDPAQEARLSNALTRMDVLRSKWRVAWEKKCSREAKSRAELLLNFLDEYRQSSQIEAVHYAYQVRSRVIIELLLFDKPSSKDGLSKLEELDKMILTFWVPGDFAWEPALMDDFPREKFWYLYGYLKS